MNMLNRPPVPGNDLRAWASRMYEYLNSQSPVKGSVGPEAILLAHQTNDKAASAATPGLLMFDPASGSVVMSRNGQWLSLLDRANHFGTQTADTISDFTEAVRDVVYGVEQVTASGTPFVVTANTPDVILVTGSSNQTIVLPDVTTLTLGRTFTIINKATGFVVTVQSSGNNNIGSTITNNSAGVFTCILLTGTTAASWHSIIDGTQNRSGTGSMVLNTNATLSGVTLTNGFTVSSGLALLLAADGTNPSARLPHGTAPAAPTNGDMWTDTNGLKVRINGQTIELPSRHGHSPITPGAGLFVGNSADGSALGTQAQVADRTIVAPFTPAYNMTIDQLGVSVSTGVAASNAKCVIFDTDSNGRPGTLLRETPNISAAAAATVFGTITSLTLVAGKTYWIGVRASTTFTLRTLSVSALPVLDYTNAATPVARQVLIRTEAFAGAAANWTYATSQHSNALMPLVLMRLA